MAGPRRLGWPVRLAIIALALVAALVAAALGAGAWLSAPAPRTVGPPPRWLPATPVSLPLSDGRRVAGWFARGARDDGAVLLLHGVRSDRRQMLRRARLLQDDGYAVLLIDLPAHGQSSGRRIGFGHAEAAGVLAALAFLRDTLPGQPLGVIGVSLGAAALVYAQPRPAPQAVVLESMYPTLAEATANRLRLHLGPAGGLLAPALLWQVPLWLGVGADTLQPVAGVAGLGAPVLIAAGGRDRHTTPAETRRLYDAAAMPKALWLLDGAGHVDLCAADPAAYRAQVLPFLQRHLRPAAGAAP